VFKKLWSSHLCILNRVDKANLHLLQEMQIGKRIERLKKGKAKDSQSKVKVENLARETTDFS